MAGTVRSSVALCALIGVAVGCSDRPRLELGSGCDLTTDCSSDLVCRLGRCREECRDARDCRSGLTCVLDSDMRGVCQVPSESTCERASDCPDPLVCRFTTCTNECVDDRDCPTGSACTMDVDGMACRDPATIECRLNSECPPALICARDHRCREQCRTDRDCRDGTVCNVGADPNVCQAPSEFDAGMLDGGVDAAVTPDGGVMAVAPPSPTFGLGEATTCIQRASDVQCFGRNSDGQAGIGSTASPIAPGAGVLTSPAGPLAVYATHTCAVDASGVWCWGDNTYGQLGTGGPTSAIPVSVSGVPSGIIGLAAGREHTCAWTSTTLYCWGRNQNGQVGDGSTTNRPTPVPVVMLGGRPVHVAAGSTHTCAVLETGLVRCWGGNDVGQLGTGAFSAFEPNPVDSLVTAATEVAAGIGHTCARLVDGTMKCWGWNDHGQLGNGGVDAAGAPTPASVPGMSGVARISAFGEHTCAITSAGATYCWGDNIHGQLGTAVSVEQPTPTRVPTPLPATATELHTGTSYTCVRVAGAATWCFGWNNEQQFGSVVTGTSTPMMVGW